MTDQSSRAATNCEAWLATVNIFDPAIGMRDIARMAWTAALKSAESEKLEPSGKRPADCGSRDDATFGCSRYEVNGSTGCKNRNCRFFISDELVSSAVLADTTTPRTDAKAISVTAISHDGEHHFIAVPAGFSREMERELAWCRKLIQDRGDALERKSAPSAEVEPLLLNWLREKAPDCGDNSCLFGGRGKGGMRTNGGCRCFKDVRPDMHRIFIERMWQAVSSMPSATASTMLDEAIELLRSVEFTTAVVAKCPVCLGFEKDGNGETSRHHNATCKLADFLRRSDSGKADK